MICSPMGVLVLWGMRIDLRYWDGGFAVLDVFCITGHVEWAALMSRAEMSVKYRRVIEG